MLRRLVGNQRGQSLVELTLMLPVLTLILVLALDFGRVFYYQVNITGATREAAREAGIPTSTDAQIRQVLLDSLGGAMDISAADITITPSERRSGEPVEVRVTYNFVPITPMLAKMIDPDEQHGGALELSSKSVVMVQ